MTAAEALRIKATLATPGPRHLSRLDNGHIGIYATAPSAEAPGADTPWRDTVLLAEATEESDAIFLAATDPESVLSLMDELREANDAIAAVKALHSPDHTGFENICRSCSSGWPCETVKAIDLAPLWLAAQDAGAARRKADKEGL